MIPRAEIFEASRAWGLRPEVVEKDYILGWLLFGLSREPQIQQEWVFKGGTCIKKCYLETYRFSEDLDFSLTPEATREPGIIADRMRRVCAQLSQATGITFPPELIQFESNPNRRGSITLRGKVAYRGPLDMPGPPRIQFDLTTDELLVQPPILRTCYHPYSDAPRTPPSVHCYPLEEILAEKTRALAERAAPRDLYDIVRLFRHEAQRLTPALIHGVVMQKCAHRQISVPTLASVKASERYAELESEWANMLGHQLPDLPGLDEYIRTLSQYFDWLNGAPVPVLPAVAVPDGTRIDPNWRPPEYISLPSVWGVTSPLEAIRFAGANCLCIELDYAAEQDAQGVSLVEPYSFRLSQAGDVLFFGLNVEKGQVRVYRADRIRSVIVTKRPFQPRWQVEF
jgi:predicted nucleotidyltransferase component of viral defense system